MKIVYLSPLYCPIVGGLEEATSTIAEYFAKQGHDVYVITYNRDRLGRKHNFPKREIINEVNVIRVKPTLMWSHGSYTYELLRALRELRPDIVHVHAWRHPYVFQSVKLKKKLGYTLILHSHAPFHRLSQLGLVTWGYHKLIDHLFKGTLDKFDKIIALTPYEKEILVQKFHLSEDKIVVLPNGISDEFVNQASRNSSNPNNTQNIVMYLGRISKAKGLMLLVKAMKYVIDEMEDAELMLVGPDERCLYKIERYARKHNIPLQYEDTAVGEKKHEFYRECKVFANPSMYEAWGITLIEAQAHGKPCVITGTGGQIYASPPGITSLHSPPDMKSYGAAIAKLFTHTSLYKKLSRNSRENVHRYMWSKILPLYDLLYASTIKCSS